MILRSNRMEKVHSDIRGPLYEEALRMQAAGEKVLKLNTGNPASFGFTLPDSVRRALAEHVDEAVPYCDMRGMPEARRTVVSNIHKGGIPAVEAGAHIAGLIKTMLERKKSGVELQL